MAKSVVDYVWIGGNSELRSKVRVLPFQVKNILDIPEWNFDGSSVGLAEDISSEVRLIPRKMVDCPFRRPFGKIVLCDTYFPDGRACRTNHRQAADAIFKKYPDAQPWYGLEQEYFIFDAQGAFLSEERKQGQFYCGVGTANALARAVADKHLEHCCYSGLDVSGINAEVAPGQWEYQIGPSLGIDAADQLWISRYILEKISEQHEVIISMHPKPVAYLNGSGCHVNFSTKETRAKDGLNAIQDYVSRLGLQHDNHMRIYGTDNHLRMTGHHETSSYTKFTYGVGDRTASIRIPNETFRNKSGYLEDRRPASNMDPYLVTAAILDCCLSNIVS